MPGIRDVAKAAGVSTSTVSVVLNNSDKYVSEENRKKVLNAAEALGYKLPPKKVFTKETIAVLLPVITSSFFSNLLNGIEKIASLNDSILLYFNSNYNFEKEKACIMTLKKQNLSGIIIDTVCPVSEENQYFEWLKKEFEDMGITVVVLERKVAYPGFYCIYVDNYKAAYNSIKHLISKGHERIAHISGNDKMLHTQERYMGYYNALKDNGLPVLNELIHKGNFTPYSGYVAMKEFLDMGIKFTALFSANDQMAIGAIKAIKAYGKRIPQDIAVVGFDNMSVSSMIEPALSTTNYSTYQMGMTAANIILSVHNGNKCSYQYELETNLIIRRSSDENAGNEWELEGW